jgi:hypothetical protein
MILPAPSPLHLKPARRHIDVLKKILSHSPIRDIIAAHRHTQTLTQPTLRAPASRYYAMPANAKNIADSL